MCVCVYVEAVGERSREGGEGGRGIVSTSERSLFPLFLAFFPFVLVHSASPNLLFLPFLLSFYGITSEEEKRAAKSVFLLGEGKRIENLPPYTFLSKFFPEK